MTRVPGLISVSRREAKALFPKLNADFFEVDQLRVRESALGVAGFSARVRPVAGLGPSGSATRLRGSGPRR